MYRVMQTDTIPHPVVLNAWDALSLVKLQVSFSKETCKKDYILQKKPTILSIRLTVATP